VRSLDDALELDEPSMHTLLRCLSANYAPPSSSNGGGYHGQSGASFISEEDGEALLAAVDAKKRALRKSAVRWGLPPYVTSPTTTTTKPGATSTPRRLKPSMVVDGVQVRAPGHVIGEVEREELVLHDPLTEEDEEEVYKKDQDYQEEDDEHFVDERMTRMSYGSIGGGPSVSEDDRHAAPHTYARDHNEEQFSYDTADRRVLSQSLPRRLQHAASYDFPRESFEFYRPNGPPIVPPPLLPDRSPLERRGEQQRRRHPAHSTTISGLGDSDSFSRGRGGAVNRSRNGSGMTRSCSAVDDGRNHHSDKNNSRRRSPPKAGNALQKWAQVKAEAEAEANLDAAYASLSGRSRQLQQPRAGMTDRLKDLEAQFRQPIKPWAQKRPVVASSSHSQPPPRVRTPPRLQARPRFTATPSGTAPAAPPPPRRRLTPGSTLMAAAGALSGASGTTPPKSARQVAWTEREATGQDQDDDAPLEAAVDSSPTNFMRNHPAPRAAPPTVPRSRVFAAVRPPSVVPPEQAALLNAASGSAGSPGVATMVPRPRLSLSAALARSWGRLRANSATAGDGDREGSRGSRSRSNSLSRIRDSYDSLVGKQKANSSHSNHHSNSGSKINGGLWAAASAGARAQLGNVASTGTSSATEAPPTNGPYSQQRARTAKAPPSFKPSLLRAAAATGRSFNGASLGNTEVNAPSTRRSPEPSHFAGLRSNSLHHDPDGMKMMLADMEASAIVAAHKAETLFDVVNAMGPLPPRDPTPEPPKSSNANGNSSNGGGGLKKKSSILQAAARAGVMRNAAVSSAAGTPSRRSADRHSDEPPDPSQEEAPPPPIEDDPDGLKMLIASMEAAIIEATAKASSLASAVEAMGPLPREKTPTPPPQRPLFGGKSSLAAAAGLGSSWPWNQSNNLRGGGFEDEGEDYGDRYGMPNNNDYDESFTSQRAANSRVVQTLKEASRNLAQRLLQLGDDIVESGGGDAASFVHEASALAAMRLQAQVAALEGEVGQGGVDVGIEEVEMDENVSDEWGPTYNGQQGEEEREEEDNDGSYREFFDDEETGAYEDEWGSDAGSMNFRDGAHEEQEEVTAVWPADTSLPPPPPLLPPPPDLVYYEALALLRPREGTHRNAPLSLDVAPFQKGDIFEAYGDGEEVRALCTCAHLEGSMGAKITT